LYEIHRIDRFADVGDFLSYARLVRGVHRSAGKQVGAGGKNIGNAHLKSKVDSFSNQLFPGG